VWVGPAAPDQVLMPAQQRFGPDEQPIPARVGQQPCESSQHRAVGPVDLRPGHRASQHRDLVAQDKQLGVLCRRAPRQQRKPLHHLAEQQIEQSQSHMPIIAARQHLWRTRSAPPSPRGSPSIATGSRSSAVTCANGPATAFAITRRPRPFRPVPRGLASGGGKVEGIPATRHRAVWPSGRNLRPRCSAYVAEVLNRTSPQPAGPVNLAAALRHHARDPSRPLTTLGCLG
jgi:hypothetical protein